MRAVTESNGGLRLVDLHSRRIGLADVALLCDALDVRSENERRAARDDGR